MQNLYNFYLKRRVRFGLWIKTSAAAKYLPFLIPLLVVLALYITLLLAYQIQFGCDEPDCVKTTQADWGQLGDYIGGILNPIFAGFTLAVVSYTSWMQYREIKHDRRNSEIDRSSKILEHAVSNLQIEFGRLCYLEQQNRYGTVREALVEFSTYCKGLDEEVLLSCQDIGMQKRISHIKKSSEMLVVRAVLLDSCLVEGSKNFEMLNDQRISIVGSAFSCTNDISGYLCFLMIHSKQTLVNGVNQFKKTLDLLSIFLDVADGEASKFTDKLDRCLFDRKRV